MGSKVDDYDNRNMLLQTTAEYQKIWDGTTWKVIDALVETWNDQWKYRYFDGSSYQDPLTTDGDTVWRIQSSYIWDGGLASDGTFNNFNYFLWGNSNPNWKKISEVTRYTNYSYPIESYDINNNYSCSKMDNNNSLIIASVDNTNYRSFAFSGFEKQYTSGSLYDYEGEILASIGTATNPNNQQIKSVNYNISEDFENGGFNPDYETKDINHTS
ncbi:MAG: hypothetical protein HY738_19600 [Bacteroidia bacterium]|nr:hypothetical protein [Bacteroidia bacterium]